MDVGGNAKMDEFRAAMGICNLDRIDVCIEKRKKVYQRYMERLSGVKGVKLSHLQKNVRTNYAYFPVYFDENEFGKNRDDIFELLKQQNIYARKYFYPAVNDMTCYKKEHGLYETPIAKDVSLNILALPLYENLDLKDVDRICDFILK